MIKDNRSEVHLCEACARDVGLNTKVTSFSLSLPEMLTFLDVEDVSDYRDGTRCASCGMDLIGYKRDGKLGCPKCYSELAGILDPVLAGIHGDRRHIGKSPAHQSSGVTEYARSGMSNARGESVESLQAKLDIAVSEERYEDAALLRDRIRDMTASVKDR